ncbi:MAG: O-antigen ligase family protein [Candidatus Omnitrophica bacterium]|nr:O-antigen ligase family protein [Candidatus Omnitrophota bacterium]
MSFILLLLYLTCTFIRPQDWVPALFGMRLINGLALATMFFIIVERAVGRKFNFVNVPQNKLMLGFIFAIVMSHVAHTYLGGLIASVSEFMVIFILYFLILNGINTKLKFKFSIWFIVGLIFILVFQGIFQMENGYGWAGQGLTRAAAEDFRINWIGIFSDPNDLALAFIIAIGILIAFLFGKTNYFIRLAIIPMIGYLFYGIYLTNSRGGFLALMATIIFYFIKKTRKFTLGAIIGGSLAVLIFALGPSRLGLISTSEASAQGRIQLWYEGILMIKSNPLFGVGHDRFMEDLPQTAHNSYILAAAELGLFGYFFWVALIYCSYKGLSIIQDNDEELKQYALGLQSGLIGFSAAAFFLSRTYVILPYLLFALAGSLMHIAYARNTQLKFEFTKIDTKNVIKIALAILVFTYGTIKVGI